MKKLFGRANMKDTRHSNDSLPQNPGPTIPELDIIDLEGDGTL